VAIDLGILGVIAANVVLLFVRLFARSQGLNVGWWSRSFAAERELLRTIATSTDAALARRARGYLRAEIAAWLLFASSAASLLWGVTAR
jgi:hypothetical protein